ncbi:hypothetical protein AAEY27_00480 [Kosakonia sp. BYX6]|uniref:Tail fiber protein n=1 Tax=Kosakonia calanthes TaxID=3139408 RepID=A0ABZ3B4Z3_9ENTR
MADTKKLPSTDALKERFKAGSIPLQSDFANLIDMAAAGASTTGVASDQDGKPGLGMRLNANGKLELNVDQSGFDYTTETDGSVFIAVDKGTNQLVLDLGLGLTRASSVVEVSVKAATGITVNKDGVSISSDNLAYIEAAARGVGQFHGQDGKAGLGMKYGSNGKLELNVGTFNYGTTGGYMPVSVNTATNMPVIDLYYGMQQYSGGLGIHPSTGIKLDASGVSVDMGYVVPRGIIVAFYGSSAPAGWAFCDGNNGTPDLRHRFIKGSEGFNTYTGGTGTNTYTPGGTVTVDYHVLTVNEMPAHSHRLIKKTVGNYGNGYFTPYAEQGPVEDLAYIGAFWSDWLENTGANWGHNHTASFSGKAWTQNNEPQYYAIAYIMKL